MKRYIALIIMLLPFMAMSQKLNVRLPKNADVEVLVDAGTLPAATRMISIEEDKLTLLSGDEIITLYNDSIYYWGKVPTEVVKSDNIIMCYGVLVYKAGNCIKAWYDGSIMNVIDMPDDKYAIFPAVDDVIYLVRYENEKSKIFVFDVKTRMSVPLIEIPFKIKYLSANGLDIFLSEGKNIYYVSKDLSLKIFSTGTDVKSLAAGGGGVFYTTPQKCGYIGNLNAAIDLFEGNVKQILCNKNKLYMLFKNGKIASVGNIAEFGKIFEINDNK